MPVGDVTVYRGYGVCCIPWLRIGARNDGSIVTLTETPKPVPIKIIYAQSTLSILCKAAEETTREFDYIGHIDLMLSPFCLPAARSTCRKYVVRSTGLFCTLP